MHTPRIFVLVHPAYADMICYPQTLNVWESFERCGAIVKYGDDIHSIDPRPGDQLVGYGRMDDWRVVADKFPRNCKWSYVVDESSSSVGIYEKALGYLRLLDIGNMIVTYQNPVHLEKLRFNGINYIIMPQTMPAIRPKTEKKHGILLSGQVSTSIYPTRTRAWSALERGLKRHVYALETPGQDISTRRHNVIRNAYYDLLDSCKMGIVCKAGVKDRFVAKYIEMGACHMLPVGDCPSYMPDEMKRAMVDIEGMSDVQIVEEVRRLLEDAPDELEARTATFTHQVEKHYLATPNMTRVMNELRAHAMKV